MTSVRTRQFKKLFARLPTHVQKIARRKFELFMQNPRHPSFHRRIVQSTSHLAHPHHEFRITGINGIPGDYRATCFIDEATYVWVFIGTHADFDQAY
ncbi:MAG: hypothetical protein U9R72_12300 [Chloroflexota bacterium]|nr:hypothetical protein [Chloroflexota bacterium]